MEQHDIFTGSGDSDRDILEAVILLATEHFLASKGAVCGRKVVPFCLWPLQLYDEMSGAAAALLTI